VRAGRGLNALGTEQILDRDGDTVYRPQRPAGGTTGIGLGGTRQRKLAGLRNEGVQLPGAGHRVEVRTGEFDGAERATAQTMTCVGDRHPPQFGGHSTTFGTE
jgi:hypothetical protein